MLNLKKNPRFSRIARYAQIFNVMSMLSNHYLSLRIYPMFNKLQDFILNVKATYGLNRQKCKTESRKTLRFCHQEGWG